MTQEAPKGLAGMGFMLAGGVMIIDQITKLIMLNMLNLETVGQIKILDPIFNLTMVWNRGVSFGLFEAESLMQRLILVGFSLVISTVLAIWMLRATRRLQVISFGLVIGGAIGNVIDRLWYGAVVDFLDFSGLYFPFVFNVADAAISVGVALLLLDMFINDRKEDTSR